MEFSPPLVEAIFVKRYKRFLADFNLNGKIITAHLANTGSMRNCLFTGHSALLSFNNSPKRKLQYSFEMIHSGKSWIGVNTSKTNKLAIEAIQNGTIRELANYTQLKPEVKIGNSRIDILLSNSEKDLCYVEVKSVTLIDENEYCLFPDATTIRGQKHLNELMDLKSKGIRSVLLFIVQRQDCKKFKIENDIDKKYSELLTKAIQMGVEVLVYQCKLTKDSIWVSHKLEIET